MKPRREDVHKRPVPSFMEQVKIRDTSSIPCFCPRCWTTF